MAKATKSLAQLRAEILRILKVVLNTLTVMESSSRVIV